MYQNITRLLSLSTALQIHYAAVSFAPQWYLQAEQPFTPEKSNLLPATYISPKTFYDFGKQFLSREFHKIAWKIEHINLYKYLTVTTSGTLIQHSLVSSS